MTWCDHLHRHAEAAQPQQMAYHVRHFSDVALVDPFLRNVSSHSCSQTSCTRTGGHACLCVLFMHLVSSRVNDLRARSLTLFRSFS
jgi:hypothetical protein